MEQSAAVRTGLLLLARKSRYGQRVTLLATFAQDGWIGRWSPGIGDPSLIGWLTVVLYLVAAFVSFRVPFQSPHRFTRREVRFWFGLALVLLLLGINKQLDLQTAFTEFGRVLAHAQGWYDSRALLQRAFILVIGLMSVAFGIVLFALLRKLPRATRMAAVGVVLLLGFIVVRAASFHHVDLFLGSDVLGIRWNWLFECGALALIWIAARGRNPPPRRAARA